MGKGSNYRPVQKDKYDLNYLRIYGLCSQHSCKQAAYCYRYQEGVGKNSRTYVPVEDTETCEWFVRDLCWQCKDKGFYEDYDPLLKKNVKTKCLLCGGKK